MVNFNNETTITRSKNDINKFTIIEHDYYVQDSIEKYYSQKFAANGTTPQVLPVLKARIIRLHIMLKEHIKEFWGDEKNGNESDQKKLKKRIEQIKIVFESKAAKATEYLEVYDTLRQFLYQFGFTACLETKKNSTDPFGEDEEKHV